MGLPARPWPHCLDRLSARHGEYATGRNRRGRRTDHCRGPRACGGHIPSRAQDWGSSRYAAGRRHNVDPGSRAPCDRPRSWARTTHNVSAMERKRRWPRKHPTRGDHGGVHPGTGSRRGGSTSGWTSTHRTAQSRWPRPVHRRDSPSQAGRWFIYIELDRAGETVESWIPIDAQWQGSSSVEREVYVPAGLRSPPRRRSPAELRSTVSGSRYWD